MAHSLANFEKFDGKEDWTEYVERFKQFLIAMKITEGDRKRAMFLTCIGRDTYKILRNLLAPRKPEEETFENLTEVLQGHFKPAPSEIVERCKFHTRYRRAGESVATFVSELRSLSEFCNFGDTLEVMIRDRIVCGINDEAMQKRLLAKPKLSYARAIELAQSLEQADKNVKELNFKGKSVVNASGMTPVQEVHRVGGQQRCLRCGKFGHLTIRCRVDKGVVCFKRKKPGHLSKACGINQQSSKTSKASVVWKRKPRSVHQVEEEGSDSEELLYLCNVRPRGCTKNPPITTEINIDNQIVTMEVDTGAATSVISESRFAELWPGRSLEPSKVQLRSYTKDEIPVVGCCFVNVTYQSQSAQNLPLTVVAGSGPCLLGRDWLAHIRLDWKQINHLSNSGPLQEMLEKYPAVFQEGLGTLRGFKAKIHVNENAQPKYCRARSIPYAFRDKVEQELQRLQDEGTIEPVEVSDWAAPIVPVLKSDKSVRICGDFRLTVNAVSKLDNYPIPKVEDLFAKLGNGKLFTKLDLSKAYQQIQLDEESKKYVVINTHKGLFRYTRLPFGVSSTPGIFQRVMESLLQGIPGVLVFVDDILVTGSCEAEHLKALEEVLIRLEKAGLRVKQNKCKFMQPSVDYLGYRLDAEGLHPLESKIAAIRDAPVPQSLTKLKSYIGLLSYYGKFLPNLSSTLYPLYQLLQKEQPWKWGVQQENAFKKSKELLMSAKVLIPFNSSFNLTLACDASSYGLEAVLAHRLDDGTERPMGYASRTLSKAERNYSQLEKEGLACIFGIRKFHDYLYGRSFELVTDHKPLLGLFKEDRPTSPQASARIKRWALFLSSYEYKLTFRNTTAHANADALSRLPLPVLPAQTTMPPEIVSLLEHLDESPVTSQDIRVWTGRDAILSRVLQYVLQGWPSECESDLNVFYSRRHELSVQDNCLLWGSRVIVSVPGRSAIIQELHDGHPGITRMKSLARMYAWWPGLDKDIEKSVRQCSACQEVQSAPPAAPLHPWKWPTRPWARVHLDFAGPFQGKLCLVMIDAHSKWIEAVCTSSTSLKVVIEELRTVFANFGLPETIVTDNGSCFSSLEFREFLKNNGIRHTTSAPYHPASNGLAERAVQIVKKGLKKISEGSIKERLAKILFAYRTTPQCTTGLTPATLLLGRKPRTRLDLIKPHLADRVEQRQEKQKDLHDSHARVRVFQVGDLVYVKNCASGNNWLSGSIVKCTGPVSFLVKLQDGRERRCHQDQIRSRATTEENNEEEREVMDASEDRENQSSSNEFMDIPSANSSVTTESSSLTSEVSTATSNQDATRTSSTTSSAQESQLEESSVQPRKSYPQRNRRPPQRLQPGQN